MKTTLLHVRRLVVVAALLGVIVSPRAASAQSELDTSDATAFLGNWSIALETDFGAFDLGLTIEDQGGKVAASVSFPEQPAANVTDITRSGEGLVMKYDLDAQGQSLPVAVTLTVDGERLAAMIDFGGQFSANGTGTRTND